MQIIKLHPIVHGGQERISILFGYSSQLNVAVRKLPGSKWSQTNKCWHVPLTRDSYCHIKTSLSEKALLDASPLRTYLQKRKQVAATNDYKAPEVLKAANSFKTSEVLKTSEVSGTLASPQTTAWKLSKENLSALEKFIEQLKLRAYSESTIRTYRNELMQLLQLLNNKHVDSLTPDDLRRYMVYAMEKEGIKENTAHSRLNALKFYFEQVLHKEKFFWDIPRPKKPMQLPKLLNEYELRKLFNALKNKKHKAMLFAAYSAGLRVSEVVNLKIRDIDSGRMQIFVERAKGKKDRYVNLSPILLDILKKYIAEYKPRPKIYLFESEQTLA